MGGMLTNFFSQKLDIVLVGIENSGKTTLLNQFRFPEDDPAPTAPTLGASYRTVKNKGIQMKMWDLGGQKQFRSEWVKYIDGAGAVIFMVDSSNVRFHFLVLLFQRESFKTVKAELHALTGQQSLKGIPILIIGNKTDVKDHAEKEEIIQSLNLDYVKENDWEVIMISALMGRGIRPVIGNLIINIFLLIRLAY